MIKKYIVRLSDKECQHCTDSCQETQRDITESPRAHILLKADADSPAYVDAKISEAFHCQVQTVENLRKRLVTEGFKTQ